VLAAREELARPLAEVRDEIRERLLKDQRSQAFDRYLAELRTRYPVAIYEERMQDIARELSGMQKAGKDDLQIKELPRDKAMKMPASALQDGTIKEELKDHP
jgi:hypothetical protein